jgi:outer membrane protein TolC
MRFPHILTPLLTGVAFILLFCIVNYSQAEEISLQSVVAGLDSTSPQLISAKLKLSKAQVEYTSNRALPNPSLFAEGQHLRTGGISEKEQTVGVKQSSGFLWSQSPRVASRKLFYEAELAAYEETKREVICNFIIALSTYKNLELQNTMLDTVLQSAIKAGESMSARLREGDVSNYDAQRVQAELIQLHHRKVMLQDELNQISRQLIAASGLSLETIKTLSLPVLTDPAFDSAEEAVKHALKNRTLILSSQKTVQASSKAHQSAKLNQLPDFSLGLAKKTADPDLSGLLWEAEIELPLWGQRRSERNLAQAELNAANAQYQTDCKVIDYEVRAALNQWNLLQQSRIVEQTFYMKDAQLSLDRGVRLYLTGDFNSLELVDALRTGLDALQANLDLRTRQLAANLELRRLTGLNLLEQ